TWPDASAAARYALHHGGRVLSSGVFPLWPQGDLAGRRGSSVDSRAICGTIAQRGVPRRHAAGAPGDQHALAIRGDGGRDHPRRSGAAAPLEGVGHRRPSGARYHGVARRRYRRTPSHASKLTVVMREHAMPRGARTLLTSSAIGSIVEWYDFFVFA